MSLSTNTTNSCFNCGSTELETDSSKGIVYCGDCGMLQEENMIVNTLQFENGGGGTGGGDSKSSMRGQMVNIENVNAGTTFVDSCYYIKNTIKNICSKMTLDTSHVDVAFRWYKLSLQHNLTKGKSILYTLSATVYISCRQSNTPHLLIDFSSALRIDVFKIGKMFLKLRKLFDLNIGQMDPTLYMHRFVTQLKLKNKEILSVSIRLLKRMKKDWIMEGRRPNNSCGAAILVATRICNEHRSIQEIAKIVHSSTATINKRVKEIGDTETAHLEINDFKEIWIDNEEIPPITKSQKLNLLRSEKLIANNTNEMVSHENEEEENQNEEVETQNEEEESQDEKEESQDEKEESQDEKEESQEEGETQYEKEESQNLKSFLKNGSNIEDDKNIDGIKLLPENLDDILNIKNVINNILITDGENLTNNNDDDQVSGEFNVDDYLLQENEVVSKTQIWESMYSDYIKETENKKRSNPSKKSKIKKKYNFESVDDALKSLDKKVTNKINFSAMSGLFE